MTRRRSWNDNSIIDSPCHYCSARYSGCHGECEPYKKYTHKVRELHDKMRKDTFRGDRKNNR